MSDPSVWSGPAAAKANEALERRARQQHAAAAALIEWNKLTPEQQAATNHEPALTQEQADLLDDFEVGPSDDLSAQLTAAAQEVVDGGFDEEDVPEPFALGRIVFQWILVPHEEEPNAHQLGLQVQVDDSAPGGVVIDITPEMLERWRAGEGLQKNHSEYKRFAAGLVERSLEIASKQTADLLTFALKLLISQYQPTETAVGEDEPVELDPAHLDYIDDGPFADAPENADEVPEG